MVGQNAVQIHFAVMKNVPCYSSLKEALIFTSSQTDEKHYLIVHSLKKRCFVCHLGICMRRDQDTVIQISVMGLLLPLSLRLM